MMKPILWWGHGFGTSGPMARFRVYVPIGAVCKPVRRMLADGAFDLALVPAQPLQIRHRRHQIGHNHPAGKGFGRERGNEVEHRAFAEVDVHVEGGLQGKLCGHGRAFLDPMRWVLY